MIRPPRRRLVSNILASLAMAVLPAGAGYCTAPISRTSPAAMTNGWEPTVWIGNNIGRAVHGIDQDVIAGGGLGKTAFIGFSQPSSTLVFVAKPINYTPQSGDLPLVRVETLVGIQDSFAKTARDSFFVSVYNSSGGYLAGIRFDNRPATYGIWRADGANPDHDTGVIFYRGELHLLSFDRQPAGQPLECGTRWHSAVRRRSLHRHHPHRRIRLSRLRMATRCRRQPPATVTTGCWWPTPWCAASPLGIEPFQISSMMHTAATTTLTWPGQKGFDYQIEYSNDLIDWRKDLPGTSFPAILADQTLTFQDTTSGLPRRFYRVLRTETP